MSYTNFTLKKELEEKNKLYYGKDDFLGVDILTLSNKTDSVRAMLFANMLQQAVCIKNAEPPRIFTRYENQVGKYSSSYYKTKNPIKVIAKIKKFKNSNYYALVYKDLKTNVYDIVHIKDTEKLTESYCYRINNDVVNTLKKGDKVPKDTVLFHSTNFDKYMNYSYGLNAKGCFLIDNDTIEDAVVVSKSFAKRMSFYYHHEVCVNINTNDLLVNIYGNDKDYKCFPDIGEKTNGNVLVSRRRINYENALFDLKDDQLMNINYLSDTIFYAKGTLIDLDIYSNTDIKTLEENQYNEQIISYLKEQNAYYTELEEVLGELVKDPKKKTSKDLRYYYRRARDINNPDIKWRNDKSDFDNIFIVFKVLQENPIHVGSKVANRYGGKGVVSKILPDEEMPMLPDGTRAEIILNALGVCNRLNPSQLFELEINFISDNIVKDMKKMKLNDAKNLYFQYLKDVNKTQWKETYEFFRGLENKDKVAFIKEVMEEGIDIHQPPFWNNINLQKLANLYDKYGYKPTKIILDGQETENKVIMSDIYMMRLKHEPSGKSSFRSTSFINMKNVPSKSLVFKKHISLYSKTPIRIGEMELVNLLLTKKSDIQAKFNSFYANNEANRRSMTKSLLTEDPLDIEKFEPKSTENSSKVLLDVLFKTLALKLKRLPKQK